eukprot:TRINITY_DN6255_c0_g1_i1.p1 TRINITY_DN6255_c0_g1~~TRINITY_DN6255_c0_g1_i1.p1  ORF type:complete len:175 (+),score=38.12 TRINITY_DN6255_c0_g1_i1:62-586(+)
MGKKKNNTTPRKLTDPGASRLNHLHHLALFTVQNNPELSRYYTHLMRHISQKLVLRMSRPIKRTLCKYCDALMIPGSSCTVREVCEGGQRLVRVRCDYCGVEKRYRIDMKKKEGGEGCVNEGKDVGEGKVEGRVVSVQEDGEEKVEGNEVCVTDVGGMMMDVEKEGQGVSVQEE